MIAILEEIFCNLRQRVVLVRKVKKPPKCATLVEGDKVIEQRTRAKR